MERTADDSVYESFFGTETSLSNEANLCTHEPVTSYTITTYAITNCKLNPKVCKMENKQLKSVVNLSKRILTDVEVSVLSKGLSFCPTPNKLDPGIMRSDLDKLHRNMRIKSHFDKIGKEGKKKNNIDDQGNDKVGNNLFATKPFKHQTFKMKSKWGGPIVVGNLEAFIAANEMDFQQRPDVPQPSRRNFSPAENKAMLDLKNDNNIVIKPADKGSAVVVLDRETYLREGYKQLSDTAYYQKLDYDPTTEYSKQVHDTVEDMYQNGEIDETVKLYLISDHVKTARFYLLPKIHKNKIPPPCRPVVSGNQSPTERISQFVDNFLQPCSVKVKSYLKDTNEFLRRINQIKQIPKDVLLVVCHCQ